MVARSDKLETVPKPPSQSANGHVSKVARNIFNCFSSMPPPSGSVASMQRHTVTMCFASFELTHTRPLTPTATSSGICEPRRGRRKSLGSKSLWRGKCEKSMSEGGILLSTHTETTPRHEAAFELSEAICFTSLSVETFKLGFHVFVRQRYSSVD